MSFIFAVSFLFCVVINLLNSCNAYTFLLPPPKLLSKSIIISTVDKSFVFLLDSFPPGSLLMEGRNVRLCGEEVGRGTFSHRHAMLVDQKTEQIHIPLNSIHKDQKGFLEVSSIIFSTES